MKHDRGSILAKPTWVKGSMLFERVWEDPSGDLIVVPKAREPVVPMRFRFNHIWSPYKVPWWDPKANWCKDCWDTGTMESLGGREAPCYCGRGKQGRSAVILPLLPEATDPPPGYDIEIFIQYTIRPRIAMPYVLMRGFSTTI